MRQEHLNTRLSQAYNYSRTQISIMTCIIQPQHLENFLGTLCSSRVQLLIASNYFPSLFVFNTPHFDCRWDLRSGALRRHGITFLQRTRNLRHNIPLSGELHHIHTHSRNISARSVGTRVSWRQYKRQFRGWASSFMHHDGQLHGKAIKWSKRTTYDYIRHLSCLVLFERDCALRGGVHSLRILPPPVVLYTHHSIFSFRGSSQW